MVGRQVPEGSQPPGELAQAEQYRRPADQLLVSGRKVDDLAVPADEVAEQRDRRALPFLQEEVAQVEQRLGPADLPEVDQPGVAAVVLEDWAGVEVAVRQPGALELPATLVGHQLPEPVQLRGREQRRQRSRPGIGKVGDHELAVVPECGPQRPDRGSPPDPAEASDADAVEHGQLTSGGMGHPAGGTLVPALGKGFAGDLAHDEHRAAKVLVERLDMHDRRHVQTLAPKSLQQRGVDREVLVVLLGDPHVHHAPRRLDPVHPSGHPGRGPGNPEPGTEHPPQDRRQRRPVDIRPALEPVPSLLVSHGVKPY
jgi:hypothetical protein